MSWLQRKLKQDEEKQKCCYGGWTIQNISHLEKEEQPDAFGDITVATVMEFCAFRNSDAQWLGAVQRTATDPSPWTAFSPK